MKMTNTAVEYEVLVNHRLHSISYSPWQRWSAQYRLWQCNIQATSQKLARIHQDFLGRYKLGILLSNYWNEWEVMQNAFQPKIFGLQKEIETVDLWSSGETWSPRKNFPFSVLLYSVITFYPIFLIVKILKLQYPNHPIKRDTQPQRKPNGILCFIQSRYCMRNT